MRCTPAGSAGAANAGLAQRPIHVTLWMRRRFRRGHGGGSDGLRRRPQPKRRSSCEDLVRRFADSPANVNGMPGGERVFDRPLVGFAAGDDPSGTSSRHRSATSTGVPQKCSRWRSPSALRRPGRADRRLVGGCPHSAAARRDNGDEAAAPAERWARGKHFGNHFLRDLAAHMTAALAQEGVRRAPWYLPQWSREFAAGPRYGEASPWSERHAAYAAGLGTFGLCDGLITPVGKAMRCGSIVARVRVPATDARPTRSTPPTASPITVRRDAQGCIERCPTGAINGRGHDKAACHASC